MNSYYNFSYIYLQTLFYSDEECIALDQQSKKSPCVFPFNYRGREFEACTNKDHTQYWCSTRVDTNGNYIDGQWGDCAHECPKEKGKHVIVISSKCN